MVRSTLRVTAMSGGRSRWRALLARLIMAGVAAAGLAAATPAAAEDTPGPASTLEIAVTFCDNYGGQGVRNYVVRDSNSQQYFLFGGPGRIRLADYRNIIWHWSEEAHSGRQMN